MVKRKTFKEKYPNAGMRITQSIENEYMRLRKNAKSKIARIKREYGSQVGTLDENGEAVVKSADELFHIPKLNEFSSKKEFNNWVKKQSAFVNRGNLQYQYDVNEHGVVASKSLLDKGKQKNEEARKLAEGLRQKLADLPQLRTTGETLPETRGMVIARSGRPEEETGIYMPTPFEFEKFRDAVRMIDKINKDVEKSEPEYYYTRNDRMRDNFANILEMTFHTEKASELADRIRKMSGDDFYVVYQAYNLDTFDFKLYSSEGNELFIDEDNLEGIELTLDAYDAGALQNLIDLNFIPNKF